MGNTTTCVCGKSLDYIYAKDAYSGGGVICDDCRQVIKGRYCVYHCGKNSVHPSGYDLCRDCAGKPTEERLRVWRKRQESSSDPDVGTRMIARLLTLDLEDSKEREITDIAYVPRASKVKSSADSNDIVMTYFHGTNKYWFSVEENPFSGGHFKFSFKATLTKSERTTNSLVGTPVIADGTAVVLMIKHRDSAFDASRRRPVMSREGWSKDPRELSRLEKYTERWNEGSFSDKTYHVSKAVVLKVSDDGKDGTGQFLKDEYVLVEPFMPDFEKWNWPTNAEQFAKAYSIQAFGHFTYHLSDGKELVNDAQGYRDNNKYILTDPFYVDGNSVTCLEWFLNHECNQFCKETWKTPLGVGQRKLRTSLSSCSNKKQENVRATFMPSH